MAEYGFRKRKKVCRFCEAHVDYIDYKDERLLRRYVTDRGKIVPRRISGNCALHQRGVTNAIKRARHMAILAFQSDSIR